MKDRNGDKKNTLAKMRGDHTSQKPFQLISVDEMKELPSISLYPEIESNLQSLVLIFNESMHNRSMGWCKLLQKLSETDPAKTEIQEGIARYLEAANRLQRPRQGEIAQRILPSSGRKIESEVNVYEAFWEDCYDALIFAFLSRTSKMSSELNPDIGRSLIYALIYFKKYTITGLNLDPRKITRIQTTIDTVIRGISSKFNFDNPFFVTEEIVKLAEDVRNDLIKRYLLLLDLKAAFEAEPHYGNYVHFRPAILIQLTQAIDYNYCLIEEILFEQKHKVLFRKIELEENLKNYLIFLDKKRKEIASVVIFQEKLFAAFESDDFIEILYGLVKNIQSKLLPTQSFFQFDEAQCVQVIPDLNSHSGEKKSILIDRKSWRLHYMSCLNDKNILSDFNKVSASQMGISLTQFMKWKDNLIRLHAERDLHKEHAIVPVESIRRVESGDIVSFQVPAYILPYFLELNLNAKFKSFDDPIYDFFIHKSAFRNAVFQINQYSETIEFLLRQMDHRIELPQLFMMKEITFFLSPGKKGTLNNFLQLAKSITCFKQSYDLELKLIGETKKSCKEKFHGNVFDCYKDMIDASYLQFMNKIKNIVDYWVQKISQSDKYTYIDLSAMRSFTALIHEAVVASQDEVLLEKFNLAVKIDLKLYQNVNNFV